MEILVVIISIIHTFVRCPKQFCTVCSFCFADVLHVSLKRMKKNSGGCNKIYIFFFLLMKKSWQVSTDLGGTIIFICDKWDMIV